MSYSDLQLKNATQVAYEDFNNEFLSLMNSGVRPPYTIMQLCEQRASSVPGSTQTAEDVYKQVFEKAYDEKAYDLNNQDIRNWKIVDIMDDNADSGFYGCVIDPGDGNAIVAFRGSEGMLNLENLEKDWIKADLMLLNGILTEQQAQTEEFMRHIAESDYIQNYNSLSLTGHSLGGNLAMHAAVSSAYPDIGLSDKLEQCVNFDGPGNSDEYIKAHRDSIEQVSDKITHYRWSVVGGLLFEMPGVQPISLAVKENEGGLLSSILYYIITRHSTTSLEFDGAGNAIRGSSTVWNELVSLFSKHLDRCPAPIGNFVRDLTASFLLKTIAFANQIYDPNTKSLTSKGKTFIASFVIFAAICPGITETIAISVVALVTVVFAAIVIGAAAELLYQAVNELSTMIADTLIEIGVWLADTAQTFFQCVTETLNELCNWFNQTFNKGYAYAAAYPQIVVNTGKLRSHASRLQSVNSRLSCLDSRLDSLYRSVGLRGLKKLLQADILTGYSAKLSRAAGYLNDTASDFEEAERTLQTSLTPEKGGFR